MTEYLRVHNQLRTDPKSFIELCEIRLGYMKGDLYCYPNKFNIKTEEGIAGIRDTIKFLMHQPALETWLELDDDLIDECQGRAEEIGSKGTFEAVLESKESLKDPESKQTFKCQFWFILKIWF